MTDQTSVSTELAEAQVRSKIDTWAQATRAKDATGLAVTGPR